MKELVSIGVAKTPEEIGDLLSLVQQWLDKEKLHCHLQLDLFEEEKLKCEAEVMNAWQLLFCIIDVKIVTSFSELAAELRAITVTAEEGGKVAYEPKEPTPPTIQAIDVSKEVLESLDGFNWDGTAIQSLNCKGYFLGLEVLKASHQKITDLHANEFRALKVLVCDNNGLQTIDVTKCAALTMLFVEQNELTALDITKNRELHSVSCYDNHIEELNIGSMKFRKDNSYFLRCGRQTDTAGTEISLILRGMRSNQVSYWNDVLANDDSPERQYNRRIGVVY